MEQLMAASDYLYYIFSVGVFVFSCCQFFNLMETKSKISLRCAFFITSVGMIPRTFLLPAGHILDLYCIRLLNAALFFENNTKLYFDATHLEKGLNSDGREIFGALFS